MKMTSFNAEDKAPLASKSLEKSNIKCVLVGDSLVGKTCLARRLANHGWNAEYTPTTFDNYAANTTVDGKSFVLGLFDTAGQEELNRLRTLAYVNSDVFLVCFSVLSPDSLKHAQDAWVREVRSHAPHVPYVLVGTHIDVRDDAVTATATRDRKTSAGTAGHAHYVNTKDGVAAAARMGADSYVECSSLTEAGIPRLKEAAIEAVQNGTSPADGGCQCACAIM
ncbi:ras-related C3 botulinum toxin substrate 3-like [Babylonia areolata]|uniref:ras-related C3 botulinum toxin substrate 3-like n=1 Tax=Babylonia areolata TaxID=304850 RepID=UPI003FD2498A